MRLRRLQLGQFLAPEVPDRIGEPVSRLVATSHGGAQNRLVYQSPDQFQHCVRFDVTAARHRFGSVEIEVGGEGGEPGPAQLFCP
ncbi:hypothetical protein ACR6C2_05070 [Streptomyces sp. INA 01156]